MKIAGKRVDLEKESFSLRDVAARNKAKKPFGRVLTLYAVLLITKKTDKLDKLWRKKAQRYLYRP